MAILLALIVLGAGAGYGLNQVLSKKLKREVIVKPNMESKTYLYDVVEEIQANILAKDESFFEAMGVSVGNLKDYEIFVAPVDEKNKGSEEELKYLEVLQNFEDTDAIADIVRAELQDNSSFNHRITILYKDAKEGREFAEKVLAYINSNGYFEEMIAVYRENAKNRIAANEVLLKQIDDIIVNFAEQMGNTDKATSGDKIVLDNQERVNITGLFEMKIPDQDIEAKKIELTDRTDPIRIINLGETQELVKPFFGETIILIPTVLVGLFFLYFLLVYLDKKALEMINDQ